MADVSSCIDGWRYTLVLVWLQVSVVLKMVLGTPWYFVAYISGFKDACRYTLVFLWLISMVV